MYTVQINQIDLAKGSVGKNCSSVLLWPEQLFEKCSFSSKHCFAYVQPHSATGMAVDSF